MIVSGSLQTSTGWRLAWGCRAPLLPPAAAPQHCLVTCDPEVTVFIPADEHGLEVSLGLPGAAHAPIRGATALASHMRYLT